MMFAPPGTRCFRISRRLRIIRHHSEAQEMRRLAWLTILGPRTTRVSSQCNPAMISRPTDKRISTTNSQGPRVAFLPSMACCCQIQRTIAQPRRKDAKARCFSWSPTRNGLLGILTYCPSLLCEHISRAILPTIWAYFSLGAICALSPIMICTRNDDFLPTWH